METALVLSALLTVSLGILEFGRFAMVRQMLNNAAREGARLAAVSTAAGSASSTQDIIDQVNDSLSGAAIGNMTVRVYLADPVTGDEIGSWGQAEYGAAIAVRVEGDFQPVAPGTTGCLPGTVRLSAVSMMRSEAN